MKIQFTIYVIIHILYKLSTYKYSFLYFFLINFSLVLSTCSGQDIFKKSSHRKGKYLFSFPGRIAPLAAGGKLGQLTNLDTPNPFLYLEFPQVCKIIASAEYMFSKSLFFCAKIAFFPFSYILTIS